TRPFNRSPVRNVPGDTYRHDRFRSPLQSCPVLDMKIRPIRPLLGILITASVAILPMHADVHVRLKNCSDYPIKFLTFNGADWLDAVPYKAGTVPARKDTKSDAKPKRTACHAGEVCKVDITPQNFDIEVKKRVRVPSGTYLRITYIEKKYAPPDNPIMDNREKSYPVISYSLDEHERPCDRS
ncbi:MAG: hypothetical protein VYC38_06385, partial [Pseudomonadota bacterium]|nr:hypothetical protein [Pseudomonadota bacterium]